MISRATRAVIPATLLVGLASSLFTAPASAGADFAAESLASSWRFSQPIQRIQYFTLNGDEYCWYGDGWNGPGWYLCGDQWNYDLGWGGAYGWNGWGGGADVRARGPHRVGVWHPGRPYVRSGAPVTVPMEARRSGGHNDVRKSVGGLTRLAVPDEAAPHFAKRALHSTVGQPGDGGLPGSLYVPVLPDDYDRAASDNLTLGRQRGPGRPDASDHFPSYGASDPTAFPDIGLRDIGRRHGVQDFGFHPIGGFGSSGVHVGVGPGGFSGFHPIGGFGSTGIHVGAGPGGFSGSHPIGGFGSSGIHVGVGPGGFSGFHPIGGGMTFGGHVGGIGHR